MKWFIALIASGASFAFVVPAPWPKSGDVGRGMSDRRMKRLDHSVKLDGHTLADIGIEPGSITWLPPQ